MKAYTTKLNGKPNGVRVEITAEELVEKIKGGSVYESEGFNWIEPGWDTTINTDSDGKNLVILSVAPRMKPCEACYDGWDKTERHDDGKCKLCSECNGDGEVIA